jgi:hypothetical protein
MILKEVRNLTFLLKKKYIFHVWRGLQVTKTHAWWEAPGVGFMRKDMACVWYARRAGEMQTVQSDSWIDALLEIYAVVWLQLACAAWGLNHLVFFTQISHRPWKQSRNMSLSHFCNLDILKYSSIHSGIWFGLTLKNGLVLLVTYTVDCYWNWHKFIIFNRVLIFEKFGKRA